MRSARPRLIRNCRLLESSAQGETLVMPEGVIRLRGAGREIVALCDGSRDVGEIIDALQLRYPDRQSARIEAETLEFLQKLRTKRVLEF